jgi:hypothetical protein
VGARVVNFREEATVLVKDIIQQWQDNQDFETLVVILEDYLTDMDTNYQGKLCKCPSI